MSPIELEDYLDADKVAVARKQISEAKETIVIIGTGAAVVAPQDAMVFMRIWHVGKSNNVSAGMR